MRGTRLLLLFASTVIFASGCAVGNTYRYHDAVANLSATGSKAVAVAAHDQREYVISGQKDPSFVGLQRGGFGNPFDVSTTSGSPLAEDMTKSVANSLAKKGFKAHPVLVTHADTRQSVMDKLKAAGGERLLLLTLTEWKSDTYQNVALYYNVKIEVLDSIGKILAESAIRGEDDLKGSVWNPPAHAREAVPAAFKEKLEKLLNSKEVEAELR